MNIRLRIAFAVLWLCCASALSAQIGFSMPFVNDAAPGSNKSLAVRVTNFDSIVSMQFVLRWNPAVLKFLTVDQFGLPTLGSGNFNTLRALDSGYVRLVWEGPNSFPGTSVPDETTIFRMRYNVIGQDTSSSQVKFTEIDYSFPTTEFEILKVISPDSTIQAFNETQCDLDHGFVAVGYTVATDEVEIREIEMQVTPNPFSEKAQLAFTLEQTSDIEILISDLAGRVLHKMQMPRLPAGNHITDIDTATFPMKGAYFLTLSAGQQTSVRLISFL
ncbi:MAG: T9SS type A sorting domain-containing protein [Saprospiraceae bacterium]|nr:T9SS type A sorting domain-containing protein [Saprospiraceae bacterium]